MTLVEVGLGCFCAVLCLVGGFMGFLIHGWIGAIGGTMAGGGIYLLLIGSLQLLGRVADAITPIRPHCRQGVCKASDYEVVELGEDDSHIVFVCKCGTKYVRRGRRFLEVCSDGRFKPFMRKGALGRWAVDDPESTSIAE